MIPKSRGSETPGGKFWLLALKRVMEIELIRAAPPDQRAWRCPQLGDNPRRIGVKTLFARLPIHNILVGVQEPGVETGN